MGEYLNCELSSYIGNLLKDAILEIKYNKLGEKYSLGCIVSP
jgi:hypothetical protein